MSAIANYKLRIQLVPAPLWGMNMRELMTQTEWRKVRIALLEGQGVVCATCGKEESAPRRVYAHEEWEYDETSEPAVARLSGVSLLCWHCHALEHWGCTKRLVCSGTLTTRAIDDTIAHFCQFNTATKADFAKHEADAAKTWKRQCRRKWRVDYGVFTEWTAKTFAKDPLNDEQWPHDLCVLSEDTFRPSIADVICRLRAPAVSSGVGDRL